MKLSLLLLGILIGAAAMNTTYISMELPHIRMQRTCSILITNASIIDGTGENKPYFADVAIGNDRIIAIGHNLGDQFISDQHIDVPGLTVAPGFIDSHTHDDQYVLEENSAISKITQGVTTVVTGNCGISTFPEPDNQPPPLNLLGRFSSFKEWSKEVNKASNVNVVPLIGHTTLRVKCMKDGWMDRAANAEELSAMRSMLDDALAQGVFGLSSGLEYEPAINAPASEIIDLLSVVSNHHALYSTHIRNEGPTFIEAMEEAMEILKEANENDGFTTVLSHHKSVGVGNRKKTIESLAMVDEARDNGMKLFIDAYPYTSGSTILNYKMVAQSDRVLIADSSTHPDIAGKYLDDISSEWGVGEEEVVDKLMLGDTTVIYFHNDDENLKRVLRYEACMAGSDGIPIGKHPHPRLWGTFPLFFQTLKGLNIGVEEVVYRMTGLPAAVYGIKDRGAIEVGKYADLVLFSEIEYRDTATYAEPIQQCEGVEYVFVNGKQTWPDLGARGHGRVLFRM